MAILNRLSVKPISTVVNTFSMTDFSIGERLLLHLYKYKNVDPKEYYNIPWELTQDGIAAALRISRAHASIELKKHREKDNVHEEQVHIKGGKVKRKSYTLTIRGLEAAKELEERAESQGVDINTLLDMKRQDPNKILGELSDSDKFALGVACTFRYDVSMELIPRYEKNVIPSNVAGNTVINKELKERILDAADVESLKSWHSYCAEKWMTSVDKLPSGTDPPLEKAFHLICAKRTTEAFKLISYDIYNFIYMDDKPLYLALKSVEKIPERYCRDINAVRAEFAIQYGELDSAERFANEIISVDEDFGHAYMAKIKILKGKISEANEFISKIKESGHPIAMLKLADVYMDLNDIDNAERAIKTYVESPKEGDASAEAERHIISARICAAKGEKSDAEHHLAKALASNNSVNQSYIKALKKDLGL